MGAGQNEAHRHRRMADMTEDAARNLASAFRKLADAVNALHAEMRCLRAEITEVRGDLYTIQAEAAMTERQRVGFSA